MSALPPVEDRYRLAHEEIRAQGPKNSHEWLQLLDQFPRHQLAAPVSVEANQPESKFLVPRAGMAKLLRALKGNYSVAQIDEDIVLTHEDTYFDTPSWGIYFGHHSGMRTRQKFRYRRQVEIDQSEMEVKARQGKLRKPSQPSAIGEERSVSMSDVDAPLDASLHVNFKRINLIDRNANEQLSLDFDICYQRPGKVQIARLSQVVAVELKRSSRLYSSPFIRLAKSLGYHPQSFSKYPVGVCLTGSGELKSNRFKPLLIQLSKAEQSGEIIT